MPEEVNLGHAVGLAPEAAIAYFRDKGYALTWSWRDMWEEAHALAFTVAKSAGFDVLGDIRGAVDRALAEGQTLRQFSRGLEPVLRRKGWWGRVTKDGKTIELGSPRRLRTIYATNLRTAHAAARHQQQKRSAESLPYWQYDAIDDSRTRPSHAALDGLVFRHDDPIWQTHYPPNGFNCRCKVRALTERQVRRRGLQVQSSEGRLVRVDQDFGARQTWTRGYQAPNGETLIPDPGFGRRPRPTIAASEKTVHSMLRAFDLPIDETIAAGRRPAATIRAVGPSDAEIQHRRSEIAHPDPREQNRRRNALERDLLLERGTARRQALRRLIEEQGAGVEIRTLQSGLGQSEHADRIRALSRLLPANWIRRANLGPGVRLRAMPADREALGSYNGATKTIELVGGATDRTLLHELVHHIQEMHPDLDGLFYAFYRRRGRDLRYNDYANRPYDGSTSPVDPSRFGAVIGQIDPRARSRPLEVATTALETLADPDRIWIDVGGGFWHVTDYLDLMIELDYDFFEFFVGLLVDYP